MTDRSISFIAYHRHPMFVGPSADWNRPYAKEYHFSSPEEFLSLYYTDKFMPEMDSGDRIADQKLLIGGKEYRAIEVNDLVDTVSSFYWGEFVKEKENADSTMEADGSEQTEESER